MERGVSDWCGSGGLCQENQTMARTVLGEEIITHTLMEHTILDTHFGSSFFIFFGVFSRIEYISNIVKRKYFVEQFSRESLMLCRWKGEREREKTQWHTCLQEYSDRRSN